MFQDVECIGTEIDDSIVDFLSKAWSKNNLRFETAWAHEMKQFIDDENILFLAAGTFTYVYPETLDDIFKLIKSRDNCFLTIVEPASNRYGDITTFNGSIPKGNFSYSHNYNFYANKNDIDVVESQIIYPYKNSKNINKRNTIHFAGVYR